MALIRRVREFSTNVQNATNLGRGVEKIFQRVETMAGGLVKRLLADISAANTLTVRGRRKTESIYSVRACVFGGRFAVVCRRMNALRRTVASKVQIGSISGHGATRYVGTIAFIVLIVQDATPPVDCCCFFFREFCLCLYGCYLCSHGRIIEQFCINGDISPLFTLCCCWVFFAHTPYIDLLFPR